MSGEDAKARKLMFEQILSTLDYAVMMSILMIFIHFRAKMLEKIMAEGGQPFAAPIPGYANNACYGALAAMAVLILFTLMASQLTVVKADGTVEVPSFTLIIKALAILGLYVSFATLVATAFALGEGPADMPPAPAGVPSLPLDIEGNPVLVGTDGKPVMPNGADAAQWADFMKVYDEALAEAEKAGIKTPGPQGVSPGALSPNMTATKAGVASGL